MIFYWSERYVDCAALIIALSYVGDREVNDYIEWGIQLGDS